MFQNMLQELVALACACAGFPALLRLSRWPPSACKCAEAHIRKVRSLFSNLDADESGYISLVELEENMHNKSAP